MKGHSFWKWPQWPQRQESNLSLHYVLHSLIHFFVIVCNFFSNSMLTASQSHWGHFKYVLDLFMDVFPKEAHLSIWPCLNWSWCPVRHSYSPCPWFFLSVSPPVCLYLSVCPPFSFSAGLLASPSLPVSLWLEWWFRAYCEVSNPIQS